MANFGIGPSLSKGVAAWTGSSETQEVSNQSIEDIDIEERRPRKQPKITCLLKALSKQCDIEELLIAESELAKEFRRNLRAYNSIFVVTSFGVTLDKELASSGKGVYTFSAQEWSNRISKLQEANLPEEIVEKISQIMDENPYAQFLHQLRDHPTFQDLQIRIVANATQDQRVYNKPSLDQVAAIWIDGNNPNVPFDREIIVHEHSGNRHRVKHYYGCYDPLQYPLLFPNGEAGWHQGIRKQLQPNKATTTEAAIHNHDIPTFTSANEVFDKEDQEEKIAYCYCVDDYCNNLWLTCTEIETTRLEYFRLDQSNFRMEILQGIVDSIMAGECIGDKVGQRIILPTSFIGGPRDMRHRYTDAMALVQCFEKPDLFITMTCNTEWTEIQENLYPGQLLQHKPDLVTRISRAKLHDLKDQIFNKRIFGLVDAHVFVVEFQKRGLPHIHLLLILEQGHKIISADQYDKFITAELPDKEDYPFLYELIVKHMMHGPCENYRTTSPCMKDG
ncbi:uncharacterized protein [Nicotiana tomentosiformis]|uniref:uncharacterized protein n=1 Tax=Nicotiana tomentosiformis TaxID=4098 RepID=UPI00388CD2B6